ncbi:replication initiation and membrane attachment family protein [Brevibacillus brevis]|uniref:replication initiation and membrane attachment family protein n=1 Tax=Brevibacillus brevis TaxID=1393 RepID=UPI001158D527|nr:DnaD domain protein [Lysinibacillus sp. SDF0063]TQR38802.1 transposase [Lysinibacillus sp. SDF0063]
MRRLVWNELLPKDRYLVRMVRPIGFAEMGFVTQLYLPIIGVESYALYQLLVHGVQEVSGASSEGTHRSLMLTTSLSLDRLLDARERLEAIGLVEVRRRENQQRDYYYEYLIKPPLSPAEFFADYVLSLMLLNKIENVRFSQLRQYYADTLGSQLDQEYSIVENVTKDFHDVFQSLKPSELEVKKGSERDQFLTEMETSFPQAPMKSGYEAQVNHSLSVSSLRLYLPDNADSVKVLEGKNMELLFSLCHFYQLDSWGMGQELRDWTLYKSDRSLDGEVLRKRLVQRYTEDKLYRTTPATDTTEDGWGPGRLPEPGSEAFIRACRQLSPVTLLEKVVGGRISKVFLERAETLVFADGMQPDVVNALLLHTLASMQMELPKAYMETIRDSWKAKRIATVDEAVKQILERADQRAQTAEKAKTSKKESAPVRRNGRAILQDKLPASVEWQLSQEKTTSDAEKKQSIQDFPDLQKRLETLRKRK